MSRIWMPLYIADYIADTGHLSTLQHGAYLLLIMHYWRRGCLPKDEKQLAMIAKMDSIAWAENRELLASLFDADWTHKRILQELQKAEEKYQKRANAGRKGGNATSNAQALLHQSQSQSHKKDIEGNSGRKKPATTLPNDWTPSVASTQKAEKLGFNPREIGLEVQKFKNHAIEKDRRAVKWDAAFDNWVIKASEYQNKSPPRPPDTGVAAFPNSPQFQAWRTYFVDARQLANVRELDRRTLEGRPFNFESEWPPGHKISALS